MTPQQQYNDLVTAVWIDYKKNIIVVVLPLVKLKLEPWFVYF
jgi:hypothetical protein